MASYLIKGGIVVTMDPQRRILQDGAVLVEGNRIRAVGPAAEVAAGARVDRVINATGHFVIPGLINAHNHLYSMLTRYMIIPVGELAGQPFGARLTRFWWPKIEETATRETAYVGTLLGGLEMLRRGCTCTADLLEAPNAIPGGLMQVARAFEQLGMRGVLSVEASERISAENGQLGLEENANLVRHYSDPDSRIKGRIGVHTPFSSSPRFLRQARDLADQLGVGMQIHVAQSTYEVDYIREKQGARGSIYLLEDIGFLRPDLVAAHCIYIEPGEIDLIAKRDVKISFNIKSNANAANGLAPVREMMEKGVTIGLGVDGINVLDMFEMMVHAAYCVRLHYLNRELIPWKRALEMSTIEGARVLNIEHELGSLEPGKKADIVLIKYAGKPHLNPVEDVYAAVASGARGTDVEMVLVDGRIVVEGGQVTTVDADEVIRLAVAEAKAYKARIEQMPISPPWELPTLGA